MTRKDGLLDLDSLVLEIVQGTRRFHQLPPDLNADDAAAVRRQALERLTGAALTNIGKYSFDASRVADSHCENMIGVAQVPIGVAGPLLVRGDHVDEEVYVPLATTEGALVASINRGCSAIRAAGGATVYVEDVGMTRAPVFRSSGLRQTRDFLRWVSDSEEEIRTVAEGTSRFLQLVDIRPYAFGTTIFLRFRFRSGDAMGMNMATIACDQLVRELIEPATGVRCVALSGNYCTDKKPAAVNFQEGRGKRIHAQVTLSAEVLERLKTSAPELLEVQYRKNLLGSIAAGSIGFNAHVANVLAAVFLATGQDPAHVVEGSMGVTSIEAGEEGSVVASMYLPAVPLAAIGGGTALDTQREALALLGVEPEPDRPGVAVLRLAEILGAAVLAGELSLLAAFTSQDLAGAHERLGRRARAGS
ncbi:MAG TPA: hydroxymethylglutaryl-CoA reductase (NADPH) [Acidobacteriota bacterium]|nr:hydroxymethylglutaryl-CoA reductase (NADPH) [Acidobacteriota bacterium]